MATLERLYRWERFAPDIGNNRELEQPFYLELAVGLTKEQMTELRAKVTEAMSPDDRDVRLAEALSAYVRLGAEPLLIDGKPVSTLQEYFATCATLVNAANLLEVPRAFAEANSFGGMSEVFFERLSGGFTSTAAQSNGKAGRQRAGR